MSTNTTDDTDTEEYSTITALDAADADTQTLLLGRHDEPTDAQEPEELADGTIAHVRRTFEPVAAVDLPEPMSAERAREWVDANRDHRAFAEYDWAAHDRRDLLAALVETRAAWHQVARATIQSLEDVPVVSVSADDALRAIQQELAAAVEESPPTVIDETPDDEDGGARD